MSLTPELSKKVNRWSADLNANGDAEERYDVAAKLIEFLHEHLYKNYDPSNNPDSLSFYHRLEKWLNSTDNEDFEKILFLSVLDINFVNEHEMQCLYRNGYAEITRWLAKINQVNFLVASPHGALDS